VAPADPYTAGEVVEPQCRQVDAGHTAVDHAVLPEERDEKGEGRDQVGGIVQQSLALGQVLVDQPVLSLLEVAQTAVDHLGRLRRRAGGEVVLLHQGGPEATAGGIQRHPGPGDAATDDQ
jgi:hypothetical protein